METECQSTDSDDERARKHDFSTKMSGESSIGFMQSAVHVVGRSRAIT